MSRLAIFLCAVICASAVNAGFMTNAVVNVQNRVENLINHKIAEVKSRFASAHERAQQVMARLMEMASKIEERVRTQIGNSLEKVQQEIDKLTGKAEGVDITECTQLAAHLDYTALSVISNMSLCLTKKLEAGSAYVESMFKISEEVLSNLTKIRDEAHHCTDHVDGLKDAAAALVCANMAAAKATWAATKVVPAMAMRITKLSFFLGTLPPSLTYCSTTSGVMTFYKEVPTIVQRAKKCVQHKIDEAKNRFPSISSTTQAAKPTTEAVKPTTEASKPTTEASKPTTGAAKPTTGAAKPTTEASKPSTEAAKPSTEAAKPSTETPAAPIIEEEIVPTRPPKSEGGD